MNLLGKTRNKKPASRAGSSLLLRLNLSLFAAAETETGKTEAEKRKAGGFRYYTHV